MTQPQEWDGTGVDPFLPHRLAAESALTAAEQRLYASWWGSFSAWLVHARRGVLSGPVPDPHAVWAAAPLWAEKMDAFVAGPVTDTVGITFRNLFGPDYLFDARPAVTTYLAQVRNRMVRTPESVYSLVAGQVAKGAAAGESIPHITDRVNDVLSATGTENWTHRAVTVARTEAIGALNAGRADSHVAVADALDGQFEQVWLSTVDNRCRPAHVMADLTRTPVGQPFIVDGEALMFPGDPAGSAGNVINCVVGGTLVDYPGLRAVTRRWYEGDVVELSFASGDKLTVTPNHPILRADGRWTPAGLLHQGDHCVSCTGLNRPSGAPHEDRGPAEVGQLYRAANQLGHAERVAGTPPDFHGDGLDSEVEVVAVHRDLDIDSEPASEEQIEQFGLALADKARPAVGDAHRRAVASQRPVVDCPGDVPRAPGLVGRRREFLPLLIGEGCHADQVGFAATSQLETEIRQAPHQCHAADAQRLGHGEHAFASVIPGPQVGLIDRDAPIQQHGVAKRPYRHAGRREPLLNGGRAAADRPGEGDGGFPRFVATAQIVEVKRHAFAGHVFNLDTGRGWYTANGIATRNCRCSTLLERVGEKTDMTGRGFSDADEWWASQLTAAAT